MKAEMRVITMRIPYRNGSCRVTSPFGDRVLNGTQEFHPGIDLVGADGDRVLVAPCDGVIGVSTMIPKGTNRTWEWGNYVRLDTPDGYNVYLCHMAERRVKAGDTVKAGDVLGIQGNTGYSFGEHCHFEVRKKGSVVNPAPLLGIKNTAGLYREADKVSVSPFRVGSAVWFTGEKQYAYASSERAVEAKLCRGKITAVYEKGRHPYHVVGDGVYGWVNKSDLTTTEPQVVRVTTALLNIRTGAGLTFPVVGMISDRGVYVLSSVSGGWGKLKNGKGWISLAYTEKVELA